MNITEMLIHMQRPISSPNGRQKHERNMETDTDKFLFVALTISHTITLSRTRLPLSRTRLPPSCTRFQSRSRWVFYCKWSKIDWMSMNEETARAGIRVREAEKVHSIRFFSQGRGAKKKGPNCIQIRVLLWCRWWDSNPHDVAINGF